MNISAKQPLGIGDLPEEIIGIIFDYLNVSELKTASLVCVQWSQLVFSGRGLNRIRFFVRRYQYEALTILRKSQRRYRHIGFSANGRDAYKQIVQSLLRFKTVLVSLKLAGFIEIKRILQEVPNLKVLSLICLHVAECGNGDAVIQLPELKQLSDLHLSHHYCFFPQAIDIRIIAPNLQRIKMDCDTEHALNVYRHFSDQLKSVAVSSAHGEFVHLFCEIVFPKLLEIEAYFYADFILSDNCGFITGSKHLQRATVQTRRIAQPFIDSMVDNCREITYLNIRTDDLENLSWRELASLTRLNTLELDGVIKCNAFDECKPIPSLQKLHVQSYFKTFDLMFFKALPTTMPYLTKLCITKCVDDQCLQFICSNILSLKCLALSYVTVSENSGLKYLDRLPHLFELSLRNVDRVDVLFKQIPSLKISVLSIYSLWEWTADALLLIPQLFPSLQMLKMKSILCENGANINELRSLMPYCTILVEVYYSN